MSWAADNVAAVYEGTGEAVDLAVRAAGVSTTYRSCKLEPRTDRALLQDGGSGARVHAAFVRAYMPRVPRVGPGGKPPLNATLVRGAETWTITASDEELGQWIVDAQE
jgi:hypothetical protein